MSTATFCPVAPAGTAYLTFRLGPAIYAIPFLRVAEVRALQNSAPVMQPPDFHTGFVMIHHEPVDLLDLRKSFGLPAVFNDETRLLVVWTKNARNVKTRLALVVDSVAGYVIFDDEKPETGRPATVNAPQPVFERAPSAEWGELRLLNLDRL